MTREAIRTSAMLNPEVERLPLSCKCTPEVYDELVERLKLPKKMQAQLA